MDHHPLAGGDHGVVTANGPEIEHSFIADMADLKADLVGVTGKHDPWPPFRIPYRDDVAEDVGADIIGMGPNVLPKHGLDGLLVAGRSGSVNKGFEEVQRFSTHAWESLLSCNGALSVMRNEWPISSAEQSHDGLGETDRVMPHNVGAAYEVAG